ncbi:regulatory protein RecX [Pseudovibrio sp. SPO723]|uniref:regulatory protein RecX n=1 Tax=Nesiotobacter zosterae TaxID=392721 RepID=UPI0029C351A5|nr:RecX family transcriptional regulator [Pseudovibrio sp. SPO723]MDX5593803.1 RecX family transcriptional regulator [Pseudovibrio sp. SPO723]
MSPERRKKYLKNAAAYYLSKHAASEEQLRQVLVRKARRKAEALEQEPEEWFSDISETVLWFVGHGFVNDAEFARVKANAGLARGKSSRRVQMELKAKGVADEIAKDALEQSDHDEDLACLRLARRRRLGPFARPDTQVDEAREIAKFARAGFGYDTIRRIRDLSLEEAENALLDGFLP